MERPSKWWMGGFWWKASVCMVREQFICTVTHSVYLCLGISEWLIKVCLRVCWKRILSIKRLVAFDLSMFKERHTREASLFFNIEIASQFHEKKNVDFFHGIPPSSVSFLSVHFAPYEASIYEEPRNQFSSVWYCLLWHTVSWYCLLWHTDSWDCLLWHTVSWDCLLWKNCLMGLSSVKDWWYFFCETLSGVILCETLSGGIFNKTLSGGIVFCETLSGGIVFCETLSARY